MTDTQKREIRALREQGVTFAAIAQQMNIPRETVKSFCRRSHIAVLSRDTATVTISETAGVVVPVPPAIEAVPETSVSEVPPEIEDEPATPTAPEALVEKAVPVVPDMPVFAEPPDQSAPVEEPTITASETASCRASGKLLVQEPGKKRRVFCCAKCRTDWWRDNPDKLRQKALYPFVCAGCGKAFTAYGNNHRKYCSHACYIASRFGAKEA